MLSSSLQGIVQTYEATDFRTSNSPEKCTWLKNALSVEVAAVSTSMRLTDSLVVRNRK